MSTTVASRTFRSIPYRDAGATWNAIVELLTKGVASEARRQLLAVAGVASSLIADDTPGSAPILVACDGPRTRIYCVYDDDALDSSAGNEDALGFDPLKGDWSMSLPCAKEELTWVTNALKQHSTRITARDLASGIASGAGSGKAEEMTLNVEGFLK
jgi:hypothetical protein